MEWSGLFALYLLCSPEHKYPPDTIIRHRYELWEWSWAVKTAFLDRFTPKSTTHGTKQ